MLNGLNEAQRRAVTWGEGPLLILAGPGSGKTTVIVRRIQYLVRNRGIPPEEILVITFTRDAALEMQGRFRQREGNLPVAFGTFHSIFYHIILDACASKRPELLTEARKRHLILPILKSYQPKAITDDALEVLGAVSYYKNTRDRERTLTKLSEEWREPFDSIFANYQGLCREKKCMDFDDMITECIRLLERDSVFRARWQRRFGHILLDEFQDINPGQYDGIKLLARKPWNLFAVGDDDQSIYGFRGSDPSCLRRFQEEFRAQEILLNVNYRSHPEIIDAAGRVIRENKNRFEKDILPGPQWEQDSGGQKAVVISRHENREQEYGYLKDEINSFLQTGSRTCAVLFRTNAQLQGFAALLERSHVPYRCRERMTNIYEHFIVQDVMAYLRLAAGERSTELFLRIMNKPNRYLSRDAIGLTETVDWERMKTWYREPGRPYGAERLRELVKLERQLAALRGLSPYLAIQYLFNSMEYGKHLRALSAGNRERYEKWMETVEWLKEDAHQYYSLDDWREAQKAYEEKLQQGESARGGAPAADESEGTPAVQLMSIHGSKGLEFDKVWIPDCNEKIIPHGTMPDRETVEEERRIFYVAMTRAKAELELLCQTGTREYPRILSRFLNPLMK